MAITLKVKFQLFLARTILVHAGQFFFQFKVQRGGGGGSVMVCIPPSPYQIFYQLFLDLTHYFSTYKGVKILKYDKIQTF